MVRMGRGWLKCSVAFPRDERAVRFRIDSLRAVFSFWENGRAKRICQTIKDPPSLCAACAGIDPHWQDREES